MNKKQRGRYSRQICLPQVEEAGQQKILDARILIIGMGGLGSPAAMYLAAAGVGHIVISDYDRVEISNLQRQIVHGIEDVGELKANSAKQTLLSINPDMQVTALDWQLDEAELLEQINLADVVLDCSDNYPTRMAVNKASIATLTPLVSGAVIRMEGQVVTYLPAQSDSPCYQCLYGPDFEQAETCDAEGVIAPLVGVIGSLQAMQALLVVLGLTDGLIGKLILVDGLNMEHRTLKVRKDPACKACSASRN
jgi:adenylyltransferase/sulfurtransferase